MKKYFKTFLSLIIIMALAPAVITLRTAGIPDNFSAAEQKSFIAETAGLSFISPDSLTFFDISSGKRKSLSTKSLIYSLTGALIDNDFTPDEVKALSIAVHTQLCRDNINQDLAIDTADSAVFLSHEELASKFGNSYTTMRSFCDNVYDKLIIVSDEPAQLNLRFSSIRSDTYRTLHADPFSAMSNGNIHFSTDCLTPNKAKLMSLQGNTYSEILYCCYNQL